MDVTIRQVTGNDYPAIKEMTDMAFKQGNESLLIEKLRQAPDFIPELSLVAVIGQKVVGHILFHPVKIDDGVSKHLTLALAPTSVHPDYQRKGIGSKLVFAGLKLAKGMGHRSVIVLGHPEYYPKFGFRRAQEFGIRPPFDVSTDAFLAIELVEGSLEGIKGIVEYPQPFYDTH